MADFFPRIMGRSRRSGADDVPAHSLYRSHDGTVCVSVEAVTKVMSSTNFELTTPLTLRDRIRILFGANPQLDVTIHGPPKPGKSAGGTIVVRFCEIS
jgi:hypothetical protein